MEKVEIAEDAKKNIQKARDYIEKKLEEGAVIYGLTTGFGKFANVTISEDETADLQRNLIISHTWKSLLLAAGSTLTDTDLKADYMENRSTSIKASALQARHSR